jgi:hypothetical protein
MVAGTTSTSGAGHTFPLLPNRHSQGAAVAGNGPAVPA